MRPGLGRLAIWAAFFTSCALGVIYKWHRGSSFERPSAFSGTDSPRSPSLQELAAAGTRQPRPIASAAIRAVEQIRERTLPIALVATPSQRLVFGRGRLAVLADDEVTVRRVPSLEIIAKTQLSSGQAVTELADGSLLAVSPRQTLRLEEGKSRWTELPRASFFPGSFLLGDRSRSEQFWIFDAHSRSLYRYGIEGQDAGPFAFPSSAVLEDFDGRGFALLKDGAFVYTTAAGFRRFFSVAKRIALEDKALAPGLVRIFSAQRLDQAWLATADGTLKLVALANPIRVLQTLMLASGIYDLDVDDERIVIVRTELATERRWELCVYDRSGEKKFCDALPGDPASGVSDDWIQDVIENKNLALSHHAPLVAVGGPGWLAVWDLKSGRRLPGP